ncbi:hypothetical protein ABPG74_007984 [Tetrahymena malaccensis]
MSEQNQNIAQTFYVDQIYSFSAESYVINSYQHFDLPEYDIYIEEIKTYTDFLEINPTRSGLETYIGNLPIIQLYRRDQIQICKALEAQGYKLDGIINGGGFSLLISASTNQQKNLVIKMVQNKDNSNEAVNKEKEIYKLLKEGKKQNHFIELIDHIRVLDNWDAFIYKKYKSSLLQEYNDYQQGKKTFTEQSMLTFVFDLIHGLIEFRRASIIHLDIKIANILINDDGNLVYCDFGISEIKKENQIINCKGFTNNFSPREQVNQDQNKNIDFESDIYSLGKTLQILIDLFKEHNPESQLVEFADGLLKIKLNYRNALCFTKDSKNKIEQFFKEINELKINALQKPSFKEIELKFQEALEKYQDFDFRNNLFKSEGLKEFSIQLSGCSNLQSLILNLGANTIDSSSLSSFGQQIIKLINLNELSLQLWFNDIDQEGFLDFSKTIQCLNKLVSLSLSLQTIKFQNDTLNAIWLQDYCSLTNLELNFEFGSLSLKGALSLASQIQLCSNLKQISLILQKNNIGLQGFMGLLKSFYSLKGLKIFKIFCQNNNISDDNVLEDLDFNINENESIESVLINLTGNQIKGKCVNKLCKFIEKTSNLEEISIYLTQNLIQKLCSDLLIESIQKCKKLIRLKLDVSLNPLKYSKSGFNLQQLSVHPQLKEIDLNFKKTFIGKNYQNNEIVEGKISCLERITFSFENNQMDLAALNNLAESISQFKTAIYLDLDLQQNQINLDSFKVLSSKICLLSNLRHLRLSLQENQIDSNSMKCLSQELVQLKHLNLLYLNLVNNDIQSGDILQLIESLSMLSNFQYLSLAFWLNQNDIVQILQFGNVLKKCLKINSIQLCVQTHNLTKNHVRNLINKIRKNLRLTSFNYIL